MANKHRGDLSVTLGDEQYTTRINFDSIARLEGITGKSIIGLAQAIGETTITTTQLQAILFVAIKGGGNNVTEKDVAKIIWDAGIVQAMAVAGDILTNVLLGGQDEGKAEAEEE